MSISELSISERHITTKLLNIAIAVNPIFTEIKQMAIEAEAMAVVLRMLDDAVMVGPTIRIAMEHISISITCMTHNQNNMALPAVYAAALIILLSTVTRENML